MRITTERIWSVAPGALLRQQTDRHIILDEAHEIAHIDDIGGIIPIAHGLETDDFAVFLSFYGDIEGEDIKDTSTAGYLVGALSGNNDGAGLLVHGDSLEASPETFLSDEMLERFIALDASDPELFSEFNLTSLAKYIRHKAS